MEQPSHTTSKEFTVLMALLMSVTALTIDALLPALGIIGGEFAVENPNRVQLLIGGIFGGLAVGQLIAGPLSDALGRKRVLYVGLVLYLLGSVVCYSAPDFITLLCGRVVQGFGASAPYVTAVSVVRDRFRGREMARVMSVVMMIFILVPAIAPTVGQAVMQVMDWRGIFLLYILYALGVCLWVFFRLEETLPPARRTPMTRRAFWHGVQVVMGNRTTCSYMLCMGLTFGGFIGYLGASQQIFQNQFGVGDAFALYFGGLALLLGGASLLNSRLVMRYGMRHLCIAAQTGVIVASAFFIVLHGVVAVITLPMFVAYAAVLFCCFGLMFGNLNAAAMEPMGEVAGMAAAIIGATSSLISLTLGTSIGQMYDNTLIPIASGFLVLGCVSWLLMQAEKRWHHRSFSA